MYPVRIGLDQAIERIRELQRNGHNAEALVTAVFTTEKLMRRTMRYAIKARGFDTKQTEYLLHQKGFQDLQNLWFIFDIRYRRLHDLVSHAEWPRLKEAVTIRNQLVHGQKVFGLKYCDKYTKHVLKALKSLHSEILKSYGADPWKIQKTRKKSALQWLY
jgi:hypothetical protein